MDRPAALAALGTMAVEAENAERAAKAMEQSQGRIIAPETKGDATEPEFKGSTDLDHATKSALRQHAAAFEALSKGDLSKGFPRFELPFGTKTIVALSDHYAQATRLQTTQSALYYNSVEDLFGTAQRAEGQMDEAEALAILKPVLEDPSILKIGQNIKYDINVLARYGIMVSPIDDTMVMSFCLDAGRQMDAIGSGGIGGDGGVGEIFRSEERKEGENGDDSDVLKEEDGEGGLAGGGFELAAFLERGEHDGGGGHRDDEAGGEGDAEIEAR